MLEKCPACGKGTLRRKRVHEEMFGIDLGTYEGEVCAACGESFLSGQAMDRIEGKAKELGLWGLAAKVKVAKSGNSLVIRIPSALAKYLEIKTGQEVLLSPEKRHRLVLELA